MKAFTNWLLTVYGFKKKFAFALYCNFSLQRSQECHPTLDLYAIFS
jgi:hypothetical protein